MILPNPPKLRDEEAVVITEFLFDIATAVEMHYSHQLRRHYRKYTLAPENKREDDSEPF
jgi:hypothetical protein